MNYEIELAGRKHRLTVRPAGEPGRWQFELDGRPGAADALLVQPGVLSLLLDGRAYRILLDSRSDGAALVLDEQRIPYTVDDPRSLRSRAKSGEDDAGARAIASSMPGRIVRILVQPGDRVEARQGIVVVEAMKMQNELKAPKSGTVARIHVAAGATVQANQVLMVIE